MQTQIVLRGFVALARGADEPLHGFLRILLDAAAGLVAQAEIALGGRQFLFRRREIPFDRLPVILLDDLAGLVKNAEVELRRRIAAFRRFAIPFDRLGIILRTGPGRSRKAVPRLNCAAGSPCSAASRNHRAASVYSCGTPAPVM